MTSYAGDLAFVINIPTQAESLLHSVEQAVGGIGFYVDANKTVHVFKKSHLYFKWLASEIIGPFYIP